MKEQMVHIGKTSYRGSNQSIFLKNSDRLRHVYTLGKTGVGKTSLYQTMCLEDIVAGRGVCFIDPHGQGIDWLLERIPKNRLQDVVLFDPSNEDFPFGLNILEAKTESEKDFLVNECIEILYKLYDPQRTGIIGPQFEHWLRNAALTVMAHPNGGTLTEIPRLFVDKKFELERRKHVTDPLVMEFWTKQMAATSDFHRSEMLNYFSSKFGHFMQNRLMRAILGQHRSSIDLEQTINNGKILLVNLAKGKIGELNAHLLGLIVLAKLQAAILKRTQAPTGSFEPLYLFVDEFQNVTTDTFLSMLSESRKYGLAVHVAHQYFGQLPQKIQGAILGNVGTMIVFEIGTEDTAIFTKEFPGFSSDDFLHLAKYHFYIKLMIDGKTSDPFSGKSTLLEAATYPEHPEILKAISRLAYGRPRILVEQEIIG